MPSSFSRRSVLKHGVYGSLAAAIGSVTRAATAAENACVDEQSMDSIRQAIGYTEASPDQTKTCSACSFFHPKGDGCGVCEIFSGGPANPRGHCDSWTPRG